MAPCQVASHTPVPVSAAVASGRPAAFSPMLSVAVFAPVEAGMKRTEVVQAPPADREVMEAQGGLPVFVLAWIAN